MKYADFLIRGIDVSEYNDSINWSKVQAHFTAIRVGHGRVTDKRFKENWANAKGKTFRIPYWYLDYYSHKDPTTTAYGISDTDWGKIQAEKYWALVKDDQSGIVFNDIEKSTYGEPLNEVQARVLTIAQSFFDRADELSGKVNGMYCSLSMIPYFTASMRKRPLWVAWYTKTQTIESVLAAVKAKGWTGECFIWQYASDGDIDGDGIADGQSMGMPYKWLDLNGWAAGDEKWNQFTGGGNNMLLNIAPLAQRDPKWADIQLGTSSVTIGGYGCLITCASMMLKYFGFDTDPLRLNAWLKANGGYHNSNWFVWDSLKSYDNRISFAYRYEYAALDKIDAQLAAGRPVIVNVDMIPGTPVMDEHWILVVGKVDGSYIVNDPWYGTQFKFEEKYGSPSKGIYVVSTYEFAGAVPPPVEPEPEGAVLFRVKVREGITKLIIRSAPIQQSQYDTGAKAKYPEEYDVFEERSGYGRIGLNRWISMSPFYVQKLGGVTLEERVAKLEAWVEAHA